MSVSEGSALEAKDSKRITWDKVTVVNSKPEIPLLKLTNSNGVTVTNCLQTEPLLLLISDDEKCENIIVANNILPLTTALTSNKGKNTLINNNITLNKPGK